MKKERILYFDYLRIIAISAVIILHVAAAYGYSFPGRSLEWAVLNFYHAIVRWCVPVFVMISGSLFLSRPTNTKTLYSKNIVRLLISYCIWSTFYAVSLPIIKSVTDPEYTISYTSMIANSIAGYYHMWFIPMIIGLYMCVPLLKPLIQDASVTKYFLILSFIFAFLFPQLINLCADFLIEPFSDVVNPINMLLDDMNMSLVLGYSCYFVLGYFLHTIELTKQQRSIIYALGCIGFLLTFLLNAFAAWKTNEPWRTYFDNFSVNVLLESVAIHTWFKYKTYNSQRLNTIVSALSKYTFGVYWVHVFIQEILQINGLTAISFSPVFSVPIISAIIIIISFSICFVLIKIPFVGKRLM